MVKVEVVLRIAQGGNPRGIATSLRVQRVHQVAHTCRPAHSAAVRKLDRSSAWRLVTRDGPVSRRALLSERQRHVRGFEQSPESPRCRR